MEYDLIRRGDPAYSIVVPDKRQAENNLQKRDLRHAHSESTTNVAATGAFDDVSI